MTSLVAPFQKFVDSRAVVILLLGLVGGGLLACEGPAGPEGPQGPEGPPGEQGARGPAGPEPDIINLDLVDHVQKTTFDRGTNTLTA